MRLTLAIEQNKKNDPVTGKALKDRLNAQRRDIRRQLNELHIGTTRAERDFIDLTTYKEPFIKMRSALNKVNRDIVYSFNPGGMEDVYNWGAEPSVGGNLWRTTDDIQPNWQDMAAIGFNQIKQQPGAGPGHWNDPDMLEVGNGTLTAEENYTHITLWAMLAAPLIIGKDMSQLNPFLVGLLGNDEVLAVDQDELGKQGTRVLQKGDTEIWTRPLADGSLAVAFFNRGEAPVEVSVTLAELRLKGPQRVRDLWRQQNLANMTNRISEKLAVHSSELYRLTPLAK
jgi:alpha-galactosidase